MSFGYKCVGQFQDQEDINNWAIQDDAGNTTMMPGDLKYEDFNGDGVIDNNDIQPITRSNTPEIYFGFGPECLLERFRLLLVDARSNQLQCIYVWLFG